MLVTSIFSFSRNVFKQLLSEGRENLGLFRKGLNLFLPEHACISQHINGKTRRLFKENIFSPHDLDLWPTWINVSNRRSTHDGEQLWKSILKFIQNCRSYGLTKIWLSSLTLILDLPERMFQMAHLHVIENNSVILFWNPSAIVEVTVRTNLDGCRHACTYQLVKAIPLQRAYTMYRHLQQYCTHP